MPDDAAVTHQPSHVMSCHVVSSSPAPRSHGASAANARFAAKRGSTSLGRWPAAPLWTYGSCSAQRMDAATSQ